MPPTPNNKGKKYDTDHNYVYEFTQPPDRQGWMDRDPKYTKGRPRSFPDLREFINEYMDPKLPLNWHHDLFIDILMNMTVQDKDKDGFPKLYNNTYKASARGTMAYKEKRFNQNILMMAPRFHAKSQIFSIWYPLWAIYRDPNVRIIIVSVNDDVAVGFNRAILNHLENNMDLVEGLGNLKPDTTRKWGEKALLVERDSMEKDPTVVGLGVGSGMISKRADIIICDDIIDINSARTKTQRHKTKEWFENVLFPILEDDGQLIVVGTAWYKDDLYDELWKHSNFDIQLKLKALMYDSNYAREGGSSGDYFSYIPYQPHEYPQALDVRNVFSDEIIRKYQLHTQLKGGVLWEDKWSFEKLLKKKNNMSNSAFMRQYLNEPTAAEDQVFKEAYIKRAGERGKMRTMLQNWSNSEVNQYNYGHLVVAVGVDLAISKKVRSDYSAIAVWAMNEKRDRILLYANRGKWSPDETKQRVLDVYHRYNPVKVRVESVAFQDMLRQELAEDIPVEGFHTTAGKKFNEETGLAHMAMLFEQEKVLLPTKKKDNMDGYKIVSQLMYELSIYSYEQHAGDLLMASWFATDVLRDFDNKMRDNRGYFSTPSIVEQMKQVRAAHRVVLLGFNPPIWKFAVNSLVYLFREAKHGELFLDKDEPFMIFATREARSCAYIIQKQTNEIVAKLEGNLSALMYATLLEKAGQFFNDAQLVVDRNGEGEAIFIELEKRGYPDLMTWQPGKNGDSELKDGFKISDANLPLIIDHFKTLVDGLHINIPDEQLLKEMGELIGVEGSKLNMSFGQGQRIKTVATAIWLIDNYEDGEKKLYNEPKTDNRDKQKKQMPTPYLVFKKE